MTTPTPALLVLAAGASMAAPALAQTADLSYKWREGVTLTYEVKAEMLQETASPFGNQTMTVDTTQVQVLEVVGVSRGDGEIEVTTESMQVEGDAMGTSFSYDSTRERDRRRAQDDPILRSFDSMVGETYTMVLSESGEVEELDGAAALAQVAGMTEAMFQSQIELLWHVVPGDEVEVGETWTTRTTQPLPGGMGEITVELEFEFTEMDSMEGLDVAVIEVTGEASLGRGAQVQGMRVEITESQVEGLINFAPDLGLIIELEMDQDLIFEITGQGRSMTTSLSTASFMELTDIQGLDLEAPADDEGEEIEDEPAEEPAEPEPAPAPPAADPSGSRGNRKP